MKHKIGKKLLAIFGLSIVVSVLGYILIQQTGKLVALGYFFIFISLAVNLILFLYVLALKNMKRESTQLNNFVGKNKRYERKRKNEKK